MPTLLSVLALLAVAALAPPPNSPIPASDPADELRQREVPAVTTDASRLDLAALTAGWADSP